MINGQEKIYSCLKWCKNKKIAFKMFYKKLWVWTTCINDIQIFAVNVINYINPLIDKYKYEYWILKILIFYLRPCSTM